MELQGRLGDIRRSGFGVAAISYDPMRVTSDFSQRRGITFPLLSDAGSAVIQRYGILNTTVSPTNRQLYGIPFPGTFVVDRGGIVTSRVFETAYQERDTMSNLLIRLGGRVDAPATKISAPHLDLTTFSTDQIVAPGTHFSLVIDAVPGRRVHVYAPGVSGYKPIALVIQPQAGLLVQDVRVPSAEDYFFKPDGDAIPKSDDPDSLWNAMFTIELQEELARQLGREPTRQELVRVHNDDSLCDAAVAAINARMERERQQRILSQQRPYDGRG